MPAVAAPDLELVRAPMALDLQESEILSDAADTSVERDVVMKDDAKAKEDRRNAAAERILLSSGGTRRVCTRALLDHYATMDNNIRMIKISNEHGQPLRLIAYTHPRKDNSTAGIKTLQNRAKDMSVKRSLMSSLTGATDDIKNKNNIKLIQTEMKQSRAQFTEAAKNTSLFVLHKLSAEDTLAFKSALNLTRNELRSAFTFLNAYNMNIFSSDHKVDTEKKKYIHETEVYTKTYEIVDDEVTKHITLSGVRFKNIANVLNDYLNMLIDDGNKHRHGIMGVAEKLNWQ